MIRITLEQWRAFVGVVEDGGYAHAAKTMGKSQSSISYAVAQIEERTGVNIFRLEGRKSVLTQQGQALYLRAKSLVAEAVRVEKIAAGMADRHDAELRLAVETLFPPDTLLNCLHRFAQDRPWTRLEVYETVIGGSLELLEDGHVDLAIAPGLPDGFLGEHIAKVRFLPVAAPTHPLHRLDRVVLSDLRDHHHLVIRDTGNRRDIEGAWNVTQKRITFSQTRTCIEAVELGLGFSWIADTLIGDELKSGRLKPLPIAGGGERSGDLYLILQDADGASPGVQRMAQIIRDTTAGREVSPDERD